MTVCIVAACRARGESALVMCSDRKVSGQLGSAETQSKIFQARHGWYCLTAGDQPAIVALKKKFRAHLANVENIDETNLGIIFGELLQNRKVELCEELIRGRLAISYDEFRKTGRNTLPESQFARLMLEVENIGLGCEFIICGFSDGLPQICEAHQDGTLHLFEDYATIGEGANLAHASLLQRRQSGVRAIMNTVYRVYEAKKTAEHVPSVGERTHIYVLHADGAFKEVTEDGFKYLQKLYKKFAPKEVSGILIDDDYFETATISG